jgi:hypothetical protein
MLLCAVNILKSEIRQEKEEEERVKMRMIRICTTSDLTSQKTQLFSITETNYLIMFRDRIGVHSENHTKHINTLCG